jgi:enoyl-CoA hydratase
MSWKYIQFDKSNSVGNIVLNNPQKNNALNISMRYELTEILHACELDSQIKIVTISSSSENFSSGADLSEFNTYPSIIESNLISKQNSLWKDLYSFKKPIICITKGWVVGSGFEILLLGDFVFSHISSVFKMPEVKLSLTPISGGTQTFVNKTTLSKAKEILLFAEEIDVYKAYDYGLVNFYSDNCDLLFNKVDEFAENIENIALHRLQTVKKLININSEENIFFGNNIEKYYSEIN